MKMGVYIDQAAPTIAEMAYPHLQRKLFKGWRLKLLDGPYWSIKLESPGIVRRSRYEEYRDENSLYSALLRVDNWLATESGKVARSFPSRYYTGNGSVLGGPFCRSNIDFWGENEFTIACHIEWTTPAMALRKAKLFVVQFGATVSEVLIQALDMIARLESALSEEVVTEPEPANYCI